MDWLTHLLQTGDSFFPTGSYAHSLGLEGMVVDAAVTDVQSFREYIEHSMIPSLTHVDLPFVHAAQTDDVETLVRLGALCHAVKSSREIREASLRIGSQRLQMMTE